MAAIGEAVVTIRADTGSFEGDINKSIGGIAKAVAGMAIAKGAFDFVKEGVTRLGEMEVSAARTAAVIKSTGGAANVTAESIGKFGDKIQGTIGVQADLVASGQNVLLKYTDVRNEIGKGNDIFNQARTAMVDLSVATGRDMPAAAAILGRALQDPEKATGALRKAGVFLSANQQQLVKDFTASGNTIGAQKVILEAVNKVVEGSATAYGETLPAKLAVAQQSFLDVKASIASSLLPAIQLGADGIIFLTDQFQKLPGAVQTGVGAFIGLGAVAGTIAAPIESIVNVFTQLKPKVAEASAEVVSAGSSLVAMGSSAGVSAGQLSLFGGSVAASAGISTAALALTATGVGALVVGLGALIITNKQSGLSSDTFAASLRNVPVTQSAAELGTYVQSLGKVRPVTDQAIVGFTGYKASVEGASSSDLTHIRVLEGFSQVASTNLQKATAIRDEWAKHPAVLAAAGVTLGELDAKIDANSTKMAEHAGHIVTDQQVTNQWAAAITAASPVIDNIKQATEGWNAAVAASIGPVLGALGATVTYEQSVDKLTEALLLDTTGMNLHEAAGQNVAIALANVTAASIDTTKSQIALAVSHDDVAKAEDIARFSAQQLVTDIFASGAAAGKSSGDMLVYAKTIFDIPDAAFTDITNSADPAAALVNYLIGTIFNIPPSHNTDISVFGAENAIGNLFGVANAAYSIPTSRNVNITTSGSIGALFGGKAAAGAIVPARPGGTLYQLGEGGAAEAIVPLGNSGSNARDRDRVMKQAGLFQVNPMAAGGIVGGTARIGNRMLPVADIVKWINAGGAWGSAQEERQAKAAYQRAVAKGMSRWTPDQRYLYKAERSKAADELRWKTATWVNAGGGRDLPGSGTRPVGGGGHEDEVIRNGRWVPLDDLLLEMRAVRRELEGIRENQNTSSRKLPGRTPVGVRR